jgi:hypothetical protein
MGVHHGAAVVAVGGGTVCIFARPTAEDAFHQAPDDVTARVVDVLNLAVGNPVAARLRARYDFEWHESPRSTWVGLLSECKTVKLTRHADPVKPDDFAAGGYGYRLALL